MTARGQVMSEEIRVLEKSGKMKDFVSWSVNTEDSQNPSDKTCLISQDPLKKPLLIINIEKTEFGSLIKQVIKEPRKQKRNGKVMAGIQFHPMAGGIVQQSGMIWAQKHFKSFHWKQEGEGRGYYTEAGRSDGSCHMEEEPHPRKGNRRTNTWLLPSSCPAVSYHCFLLAKPIWKYNSLWYRAEQGKDGNWIWKQTGKWQAHWSTLRRRGKFPCP